MSGIFPVQTVKYREVCRDVSRGRHELEAGFSIVSGKGLHADLCN
jgi:hypothetical protein